MSQQSGSLLPAEGFAAECNGQHLVLESHTRDGGTASCKSSRFTQYSDTDSQAHGPPPSPGRTAGETDKQSGLGDWEMLSGPRVSLMLWWLLVTSRLLGAAPALVSHLSPLFPPVTPTNSLVPPEGLQLSVCCLSEGKQMVVHSVTHQR